jgi:hypothetical protein
LPFLSQSQQNHGAKPREKPRFKISKKIKDRKTETNQKVTKQLGGDRRRAFENQMLAARDPS